MDTPDFWYPHNAVPSVANRAWPYALAPISALFGMVSTIKRRFAVSERAGMPVICIGNVTAGGVGKTPVAIELGRMLKEEAEKPVFLTRGYGGSEAGPLVISPCDQSPEEVGDEALLLTRTANVIKSGDRAAGARLAKSVDASLIIMDDGFQNYGLYKDFSILVIDGQAGLGNRRLIPAGPLREHFKDGLKRAQAVIIMGPGAPGDQLAHEAQAHGVPVFRARIEPDLTSTEDLTGRRLIAYAGIGRPEKFFASLTDIGASVLETAAYADHHIYTEREARGLITWAEKLKADLVTTEKDLARLCCSKEMCQILAERSLVLPIRVAFDDKPGLLLLLKDAIAAARVSHTYIPPGGRHGGA